MYLNAFRVLLHLFFSFFLFETCSTQRKRCLLRLTLKPTKTGRKQNAPKRKSADYMYRLQVVKYANGNQAAEGKFGVSENLVRDRKKEVHLIAIKKKQTTKANCRLKG